MPDDPHVAGLESEFRGHGVGRTVVVEGHDEHGTFTLRQHRKAATKLCRVKRFGRPVVAGQDVELEGLEQAATPGPGASAVHDHLPGRAEHERDDLPRVPHRSVAQPREQHDEHVLREIGSRGFVAQVLEPEKPDPGTEAPAELRLRDRVAARGAREDPTRERGVVLAADVQVVHAASIRAGDAKRKHARRCNDPASRYTSLHIHRETAMITNTQTGTNIQEIADGIYRINTPLSLPGEVGFSFNQYLIVDEASMLFHTGMRRLFPVVSEAVRAVLPLERLRYLGLSHFEADECGALNQFLAAAPDAVPVCGQVAALVSLGDYADRPPQALADGAELSLGRHTLRWFDTPHVPHAWECGMMLDVTTHTFFCGDLFTQGGPGEVALTESDILGPSEAFRQPMDYYAHAPQTRATLERFAREAPTTLACMHGSAWRGDGARLLRELAASLDEATRMRAA